MKSYHLEIGSPVDYEELTADIIIDNTYPVRIQKEEGNDKMIVEFYTEKKIFKIYYDDLVEAMQLAKAALMK